MENLVPKLWIWGVLETKITPHAFRNMCALWTAFARSLSYSCHLMKTKIQHHKQLQSCKKNVCSTDQKTKEKSFPVGLRLNHLTFIISQFFVDEECAENWQNLSKIRNGFVNSVFIMDFGQCRLFLALLCQVFVYDSCISWGQFFKMIFLRHKRSTYTRVNTVLVSGMQKKIELKNWIAKKKGIW